MHIIMCYTPRISSISQTQEINMVFETDINKGLSLQEVEERKNKGLVNGEEQVASKTVKQIVLGNLITLFNILNIGLAVLVLTVGSIKNILFLGTVFCNLAIGIIQEIKAKRIIDKLKIMSAHNAHVLRDSTETEIPLSEIVMDDIILLKSGDQIGADCLVVSGECQVNESLVTGESDAIEKKEGDELLSGSFIVSGTVKCRVIRCGSENYVNKISDGAKYIKKPNSEILRTIKKIVRIATVYLLAISGFLFMNQLSVTGSNFDEAVINTVAAVVGMIPSGLILLISTVLATSVVRLSKYDTLVQELYCIETLARCNAICLDKTGTITDGQMKVEDVYFVDKDCSEQIKKFVWAQEDINSTLAAIRKNYPERSNEAVSFVLPFSSDKKYSAVGMEDGTYFLGAPEFLFDVIPEEICSLQEDYMDEGLRVIAFAKSEAKERQDGLPEDLIPLALIALTDTLRSNAKETVQYFIKQDVKLFVISGDHPKTVCSIAKAAGIPEPDKYIDMSTVSEDELEEVAGEYTVYGRVKPDQKLALIKALKKKGYTVAMTGDGVNDVLALKEADCSIAMQSGSSAARCASQIVLMNSDFSSMPKIVGEGRRSINNIQRSASLFLVKTVYACILGLLFAFISKNYPFEPIQLTLITTFFIGLPSLLLGFEPNYRLISGNFFKSIMSIAVPGGLLVAINVMLTVYGAYWINALEPQISTMALYTSGFCMALVLFYNCRPFNKWRTIVVVGMPVLFIIFIILLPEFFSLVRLNLWQFLLLVIWMVIDYLLFILLIRLAKFIGNHRLIIRNIKY